MSFLSVSLFISFPKDGMRIIWIIEYKFRTICISKQTKDYTGAVIIIVYGGNVTHTCQHLR